MCFSIHSYLPSRPKMELKIDNYLVCVTKKQFLLKITKKSFILLKTYTLLLFLLFFKSLKNLRRKFKKKIMHWRDHSGIKKTALSCWSRFKFLKLHIVPREPLRITPVHIAKFLRTNGCDPKCKPLKKNFL